MKVLSIAVLRYNRDTSEPVVLSEASDVSGFGFFERTTVRQMMTFFSKTVIQRVKAGQRISVDQVSLTLCTDSNPYPRNKCKTTRCIATCARTVSQ